MSEEFDFDFDFDNVDNDESENSLENNPNQDNQPEEEIVVDDMSEIGNIAYHMLNAKLNIYPFSHGYLESVFLNETITSIKSSLEKIEENISNSESITNIDLKKQFDFGDYSDFWKNIVGQFTYGPLKHLLSVVFFQGLNQNTISCNINLVKQPKGYKLSPIDSFKQNSEFLASLKIFLTEGDHKITKYHTNRYQNKSEYIPVNDILMKENQAFMTLNSPDIKYGHDKIQKDRWVLDIEFLSNNKDYMQAIANHKENATPEELSKMMNKTDDGTGY